MKIRIFKKIVLYLLYIRYDIRGGGGNEKNIIGFLPNLGESIIHHAFFYESFFEIRIGRARKGQKQPEML
jgi:hypothetical protein